MLHFIGGVGGLGGAIDEGSGAAAVLHSAPVVMALMGFLISYTMIFILKA